MEENSWGDSNNKREINHQEYDARNKYSKTVKTENSASKKKFGPKSWSMHDLMHLEVKF